jgi:hypothetical protein
MTILERSPKRGEGVKTVYGFSKLCVPVRIRSQSLGVIGCRFVFRTGGVISPTQNPAYSPLSTHKPNIGQRASN